MTEYEQNIEIMKDLRNRIDAVLSTSSADTKRISIPDPLKHKYISFAKSGIRIVAGGFLCAGQLYAAGALLILAEVLGIAEEMV
jgi:hypothetical protein